MNIKKITDNYILEVIKSIDSDRLLYYGIAILFVVFYHALCFGHSFIAFKIFKYGYIGVDIFLFFSGYGLCYSYGKSRLFIVYAIFKSLALSVLGNETLSTWDWFCNITTLSYYQIGGMFIDWYLCALLLLYITFPLFRSFARQTSLKGLIVITIICYLVLMQINISWIHQCLI